MATIKELQLAVLTARKELNRAIQELQDAMINKQITDINVEIRVEAGII